MQKSMTWVIHSYSIQQKISPFPVSSSYSTTKLPAYVTYPFDDSLCLAGGARGGGGPPLLSFLLVAIHFVSCRRCGELWKNPTVSHPRQDTCSLFPMVASPVGLRVRPWILSAWLAGSSQRQVLWRNRRYDKPDS